jgi:hypothetical protein
MNSEKKSLRETEGERVKKRRGGGRGGDTWGERMEIEGKKVRVY